MMTIQTEKLTPEMIENIMRSIAFRPKIPVGEHLSDDECVAYVMEACTPGQLERIEQHMESCEDCVEELNWLYECEPFWNAPQAQAAYADAIASRKPINPSAHSGLCWSGTQLTDFLKPLKQWKQYVEPALIFAKSEAPKPVLGVLEYHEAGNRLYYRQSYREGELVIAFSSKNLDAGRTLTIRAGRNWQRKIELQAVGTTEIAGTLIVPVEEFPDVSLEMWEIEWH
ncbi:MAG: hypothetical protein ACRERV_05120 [Methylococcales bacterium]